MNLSNLWFELTQWRQDVKELERRLSTLEAWVNDLKLEVRHGRGSAEARAFLQRDPFAAAPRVDGHDGGVDDPGERSDLC